MIKTRKLNDTLQQHLTNVIRLFDVNLVIDVGANNGQYGTLIRSLGFTGRIVSFDPLPGSAKAIGQLCNSDPEWQAHEVALGSYAHRNVLNRFAATEFSSLLQANTFASERFKWRAQLTDQVAVDVVTLASKWPAITNGLSCPKVLLKLDTQGYDLEVFAGAEEILDDVVALQSEISLKAIYHCAPRYLESLNEYERHGFEISGLYPVSRDKRNLAVIEYDCVMTRAYSSSSASTTR